MVVEKRTRLFCDFSLSLLRSSGSKVASGCSSGSKYSTMKQVMAFITSCRNVPLQTFGHPTIALPTSEASFDPDYQQVTSAGLGLLDWRQLLFCLHVCHD